MRIFAFPSEFFFMQYSKNAHKIRCMETNSRIIFFFFMWIWFSVIFFFTLILFTNSTHWLDYLVVAAYWSESFKFQSILHTKPIHCFWTLKVQCKSHIEHCSVAFALFLIHCTYTEKVFRISQCAPKKLWNNMREILMRCVKHIFRRYGLGTEKSVMGFCCVSL